MSFNHQDWKPVVIHNEKFYDKITKHTKLQNPTGTKDRKLLESDDIYQPNKMTSEQAKILREARCAKGLTQKEFAKSICKDVGIIQSYESGKIVPFNLTFYKYLLKCLGVK